MQNAITLIFTTDEVNTVLAALSELPYKSSATLIHRIAADANRQLQKENGDIPLSGED